MWQQLLEQIQKGDAKALARGISFVENEQEGFENLLAALPHNTSSKIIGVTGPPGAGKSTLVDGLIREIVNQGLKVCVLCVDPSSPFNLGAVLGDRIRMSEWYLHPNVFIRSLASRGAMGGLHPKIMEIAELVKTSYDFVIIETVGVGQSEVEIAGLADVTVVVLVPEAGDEIQTMKAGLMEIADIFVVNKSDRPDADAFVKNLRMMLAPAFHRHDTEVPIVKTCASQHTGIDQLYTEIQTSLKAIHSSDKKYWLLAEKAYHLIQSYRMKDVSKQHLFSAIAQQYGQDDFNIYKFVQSYEAKL
jgi:LAO/AO transport system kinase